MRKKQEGADAHELDLKKQDLETRHHSTVWHEMKRQRSTDPALEHLFRAAAELL
ncbi:MAG: hypothetical protein GY754_09840 [bacterium]|nr:hypothetical protein [bacterium]